MTGRTDLTEVRLGGRNFLRLGDPVRVKPSRPGRRDGYVGIVRRISLPAVAAGNVEVDVLGAPANRPVVIRSFYRDRLERVTRGTAPTHHHAEANR